MLDPGPTKSAHTSLAAWIRSISAAETPSLLAPDLLAQLFSAIRSEFNLDANAEITMECAPGQLADATLEAMVAAGVNRVSLGVQSFVDSEAHASGRLHSRAIIEQDLRRLRAAGIADLNLDLIAGLAGQTSASWEESLAALIDSGVPHASLYMLEVDEDSRLGRELLKRGARYRAELVPHDDAIAQMYERAIERLGESGLCQYEISNFSRPGFESKHNLRYWQRRPYLGVGLDASSMLRFSNELREPGFVSGHDFSRAASNVQQRRALAPVSPDVFPLHGHRRSKSVSRRPRSSRDDRSPKSQGSRRRASTRKPGSRAAHESRRGHRRAQAGIWRRVGRTRIRDSQEAC